MRINTGLRNSFNQGVACVLCADPAMSNATLRRTGVLKWDAFGCEPKDDTPLMDIGPHHVIIHDSLIAEFSDRARAFKFAKLRIHLRYVGNFEL